MTAPYSRSAAIAEARRLHAAGKIAAAEAIYRTLLARDGDDAEVLHLAGVARHQLGDHAGAVTLVRRALTKAPELAAAWQNLVLPLLELGRLDEAVAAGSEAVRLAPGKPGIWTNHVLALIRAGRLDEAARGAETAIAITPADPMAWSQLGHIRMTQGDAALAGRLLDRALDLDPSNEEAHYNRGVAAQALSEEAVAETHYRSVLAGNPAHRGARLNLGVALRSQGRIAEALRVWAASPEPPETWPELAYDIACARLMAGDWREGWPGYELRFATTTPIVRPPRTEAPRWDGSPLPGATLMVHHEQGLGDTIQFVRLLPAVAGRVGRIVFVCQPPLKRLLAGMPLFAGGAADVVAEGEAIPAHAAWVPLLSLPLRLDLDRTTLPRRTPYLSADPARIAPWAARLDAIDGGAGRRRFRVGLSWQGNPKAPVERGRSIPLAHFAPLGAVDGVAFVALQKGPGREQPVPAGLALADLGADFDAGPDAFLDTAAVMASLDLVLTSDTAIAHVAGALGRPVWLLLEHVPDWRWGVGGRLTPWYPTMRLFRQPAPGDWDGLMAEVVRELAAVLPEASAPAAPGDGDAFDAAVAEHRAGRLPAAIAAYERLRAARPRDGRLANYLGMARFDAAGRSGTAAASVLPLVLRSVGLAPADADGFANLAVVLKGMGALGDAREALGHALALDPGNRAAALNLVNLDLAEGGGPAAVERAIALAQRFPSDAGILVTAANAAKAAGRRDDAAAIARRAVVVEPEAARHRVLLGSILADSDPPAAAAAWDEALLREPDHGDALSNQGVHERNHGVPALGLWYARQAVAADPLHADAWSNLGIAAGDVGRRAEADAAFERAVAIRPDYANARMALGIGRLAEGRFAEGFPDYEWRLKSEQLGLGMQPGRIPAWNGGDPAGLSFLVMAEQGFGDAIQFVRYAALLKARGAARVVVGCRSRLKALMATAAAVDGVIGEGERLPAVDHFVPLMSLPFRLGTTVDSIPAPIPYLAAEAERVQRWAERLAAGDGFRVGLVWQGNPDRHVDRGRSIALASLAPLGRIPGLRLIALQKGPGSEQVEAVASFLRVESLGEDFDAGRDAFADTAAVMANLDLVVTTDTAVAHLAGALGRPTWLLLKADPEWRWLAGRNDTPWYPSMRLFRQRRGEAGVEGDLWARVVARLAGELARLVDGDRSRLVDFTADPVLPPVPPVPVARRFEAAFAAHRAGRLAAARAGYADVLLDAPGHGEALHMLGAIALQERNWPRALFMLDRAVRAGLATAELDTNRAVALRNLGRLDEAEPLARAVMRRAPSAEAALTLGNLQRDRDEPEAAVASMRRAVELGPTVAKAHRGLGNALKDLGRNAEAIAAFDRALAIEPEDADLRLDRAHALLAAGRLGEGFAEYEWRWRTVEMAAHGHAAPAWDGTPCPGRTLLVHGEQGLGDNIQFARFLAAAAARVGRLVIAVRRPLLGLFRSLDLGGIAAGLVEAGQPLPPHDLQLPMMSLAHVLDIAEAALPGRIPYLAPEAERVARWRERLGDDGRPKIGLVWQGNPKARADRGRSPPLAALAPLLALDGLRFVSLQKQHGLDQLDGLALADRIERLGADFDAGPDAFLDTAAVMAGLDLVVCSDTAAAHLAGALGRPALLMLKHAADWRWQSGRADSPWYPSLRLLRQPAPGDWTAVAGAVAAAVAAMTARR